MEVYVLVDDWMSEDGGGIHILGVYKSRESARKALKEYVKLYDGPIFDTVEQDDDSWVAYNKGRYSEGYTSILIISTELED